MASGPGLHNAAGTFVDSAWLVPLVHAILLSFVRHLPGISNRRVLVVSIPAAAGSGFAWLLRFVAVASYTKFSVSICPMYDDFYS